MPALDDFVVPARRSLGPIKQARGEMTTGEAWKATIASSRYGVYTIAGRVRGVGTDLHVGGYNLGSSTSAPGDLQALARVDSAPDEDSTGRDDVAHGDIVSLGITYRPDEVITVSGVAAERNGYGHLIVGGWHVAHPAVHSVRLIARAGGHPLGTPAPLPALKTE